MKPFQTYSDQKTQKINDFAFQLFMNIASMSKTETKILLPAMLIEVKKFDPELDLPINELIERIVVSCAHATTTNTETIFPLFQACEINLKENFALVKINSKLYEIFQSIHNLSLEEKTEQTHH